MAGCSRPGQVRRHNDESGPTHRWRHATSVAGGFTLLLGLTGMASVNIAQASQPAKALGCTWTIETTPNATGAAVNELSAVSCISPRACTAVGSYAETLSTPSVPPGGEVERQDLAPSGRRPCRHGKHFPLRDFVHISDCVHGCRQRFSQGHQG